MDSQTKVALGLWSQSHEPGPAHHMPKCTSWTRRSCRLSTDHFPCCSCRSSCWYEWRNSGKPALSRMSTHSHHWCTVTTSRILSASRRSGAKRCRLHWSTDHWLLVVYRTICPIPVVLWVTSKCQHWNFIFSRNYIPFSCKSTTFRLLVSFARIS